MLRGEFGLWYDQFYGWKTTNNENLYLKDVEKIKETLSKYDLIIWSVPVIPLSNKNFADFDGWRDI